MPLPLIAISVAALTAVSPPSAQLSKQQTVHAVEIMARGIADDFPVADIAQPYADVLRRRLQSDAYDGLTACSLARHVNADLQAVRPNPHLWMRCAKDGGLGDLDQASGVVTEVRISQNPPYAYIRSPGPWPSTREGAEEVVRAMNLIAGSKNIIIDVRGNHGGSGTIGNMFASYLYGYNRGEGHMLVRGVLRDRRQDTQEGTYPYVPGPRSPDARVFILVDKDTVSATEGFAFGLQHAKRASIVGQTTAGGGSDTWPYDLGGGLTAFIPHKVLAAPDGSPGWEGVGVRPDVVTAPGEEVATVLKLIESPSAQP